MILYTCSNAINLIGSNYLLTKIFITTLKLKLA